MSPNKHPRDARGIRDFFCILREPGIQTLGYANMYLSGIQKDVSQRDAYMCIWRTSVRYRMCMYSVILYPMGYSHCVSQRTPICIFMDTCRSSNAYTAHLRAYRMWISAVALGMCPHIQLLMEKVAAYSKERQLWIGEYSVLLLLAAPSFHQ